MMLSALLAASCSGDCCRMAVVKLATAASGMTAVYTQILESDLQHRSLCCSKLQTFHVLAALDVLAMYVMASAGSLFV